MQVGDRVRVWRDWTKAGEYGTVRDVQENSFYVALDNATDGTVWLFQPDMLDPLPKEGSMLRVGDRVRVKEGARNAGALGTVMVVGAGRLEGVVSLALDRHSSHQREYTTDMLELIGTPETTKGNPILDTLISTLDNEPLGKAVRALRKEGLL